MARQKNRSIQFDTKEGRMLYSMTVVLLICQSIACCQELSEPLKQDIAIEYELNSENKIVLKRGFLEKNFRIGHNRRLLEKQLKTNVESKEFASHVDSIKILPNTRSIEIEVVMSEATATPATFGVVSETALDIVSRSDSSSFQITFFSTKRKPYFRSANQVIPIHPETTEKAGGKGQSR